MLPDAPQWDTSAQAVVTRSRATEQLRETYEKLFELQHAGRDSLSPDWWKEQFCMAASDLASSVPALSIRAGAPPPPSEVSIWCDGQEHIFSCDTDKTVLVGRYNANSTGCDVRLPDNTANSRLAAVLLLCPGQGTMVAADMGGLFGISTIDREQDRRLDHSLPRDRRALVFELGEAVQLRLGASDVLISPKMCVTCERKPRQYRFDCGHAVCCQDCVRVMRSMADTRCPVCRRQAAMKSVPANTTDSTRQWHAQANVRSFQVPEFNGRR